MTIDRVYATLNAMTKRIDGKALSVEILDELSIEVAKMARPPALAIVAVGETADSVFIRMKTRAAERVGIGVKVFAPNADISTTKLSELLNDIAHGSRFDGIVVQLPLPASIDNNRYGLLRIIPEDMDVDCISERWLGRLLSGRTDIVVKKNILSMLPPLVGAIKTIFDSESIDVKGKRVVVVGWGDLVGKPVATWLLSLGATVTVATSAENDIGGLVKDAEIIVAGTGNPRIINGDMIKEGAVVLDAGTSTSGGGLSGDVDADSVDGKASIFSASPGGIGPLTVASLLRNVVLATQAHRDNS